MESPVIPLPFGLKRIPAWLAGWRSVAAVASGAMLALAFPPFEAWQLAWVALVPLLIALTGVGPAEGARLGWRAGLTFWLVTLSWLLRLLQTSPAPFPLILLGWVLLAGYCALYMAGFGLTFAWLVRRLGGADRYWQTLALMGLASAVWTGGEYARGVIGGGFPWNGIGVSQYRFPVVIQSAEWGGVAAVSALVVLVNAGIAFTVRRYLPGQPQRGYRPHVELFLGLLATALCFRQGIGGVRQHAGAPTGVTVAAIQPAIPQLKKWAEGQADRILSELRTLTESALQLDPRPDLMVWPETATPECVTDEGESRDLVLELSRKGVPLLVGSMVVAPMGERDYLCYNASILFDRQGQMAGRYDKQHLVPFGEYIPLSGVWPFLARLAPMGWNCTAGQEATVLRAGPAAVPFSCLICFEDILPGLARSAVRNGARLLINQTNDAWFDRTGGPLQHMSHSVFRAVENRVPVVRVANSGITCLIHPNGAIEEETVNAWSVPPKAEVMAWPVGVPGPEWVPTLYSRYGDCLFALPCGVIALVSFGGALVAVRRERRAEKGREAK